MKNGQVEAWAKAQMFVGQEAFLLDEKLWDEWLDLYLPDCEFWLPAWGDDGELTQDPQSQISMIYYANRGGLEDRVFRIRTGTSAASTPPLRTNHLFSVLKVEEVEGGYEVRTNWLTESFREDQCLSYRGQAVYRLVEQEGQLKIASKRTVVLDPITDTVLDFYTI